MCKVLNEHRMKKLNVVDILVSLNFMHMKMCLRFFASIVAMENSSSLCVFPLSTADFTSLVYLLGFLYSFCSFKNNFPHTSD